MTAAGTWVITISTGATRQFVVLHLAEGAGGGLTGRAVSGVEAQEVELLEVSYDGEQLAWLHPLDGVSADGTLVAVSFTAKVKGNLMTGRSQSHFDATVVGTRSAS